MYHTLITHTRMSARQQDTVHCRVLTHHTVSPGCFLPRPFLLRLRPTIVRCVGIELRLCGGGGARVVGGHEEWLWRETVLQRLSVVRLWYCCWYLQVKEVLISRQQVMKQNSSGQGVTLIRNMQHTHTRHLQAQASITSASHPKEV